MRYLKFTMLILMIFSFIFCSIEVIAAKERTAEVTVKVDLNAPAESKDIRLWIPYPVSDENQTVSDLK